MYCVDVCPVLQESYTGMQRYLMEQEPEDPSIFVSWPITGFQNNNGWWKLQDFKRSWASFLYHKIRTGVRNMVFFQCRDFVPIITAVEYDNNEMSDDE
jgi:hypothetical protein